MSLLEIFDVAHGQCSLLTSSTRAHLLIDCGHNGGTEWRPSEMLRRRGVRYLDELIITNYDEDHVSDLPGVLNAVGVGILNRNPTVSGADLYRLKQHRGMGRGIATLANMTREYGTSVSYFPDYDGMTYRQFWNRYPDDFDDENNLSLVTVMRWPGYNGDTAFSILYAGDMERAGWLALLRREDFRAEMRDITVFVASHHGRLNGYCRELFERTDLKPVLFVISDCGIQYATQETIALYRRHASGVNHKGEYRRVITTRRDGYVSFIIGPDGATLQTAR